MKIAKAILIDPDRNLAYGTAAIALSLFVFAYSTLFGKAPILVYYAIWFPLVLVDYRRVLGDLPRTYWIVPFGVLACLSVFWSQAPGVSARAAIQLATHILCAFIAARTIGIRTLTLGTLVGISLVVLYSLAFGSYNYDPFDGDFSFSGAFASKNLLGFFCSIGIYFAFACIFVLRERALWCGLALICAGLAGYALIASHSATALITTIAALLDLIGLGGLTPFPPRTRKTLAIFGILVGIGMAAAAMALGGFDFILAAFGKNTTLTGRTYLWSQGLAAAANTPLLGVGYQAYWVQGFPDAERLWAEFYITARTGFHFHNTYIETLVELGAIGVLLLAIVLIRTSAGFLMRFLGNRNDVTARIMLGLLAMLLLRSFVEVDVIAPYAIGSFLLYYSAALLAAPQSRQATAEFGRPSTAWTLDAR
jgi:exopolysaccharide production protein ExoQ